MNTNIIKYSVATGLIYFISYAGLYAQSTADGGVAEIKTWNDTEKINLVLSIIAAILLWSIWKGGKLMLTCHKLFLEKKFSSKNDRTKLLGIALLLLFSSTVFGQGNTAKVSVPFISSFDSYSWLLISVIGIEALILILINSWSKKMLSFLFPKIVSDVVVSTKPGIWEIINQFKSIEQEGQIDTGHNYDGIRELDNVTPPWFTISFGLTILFAIVYLWRYHVSDYGPSPYQEYKKEMVQANLQMKEYMATQANIVDENNIVMVSAAELAEGQNLFKQQCAVCHLQDGGGLVGPNLTDKYWLHGGSLNEIFKVIKYGVVEKGMKSWKEDFSASQIVQLSCYIKSLTGTKPLVAKEPQGELYQELPKVVKSDSTPTGK